MLLEMVHEFMKSIVYFIQSVFSFLFDQYSYSYSISILIRSNILIQPVISQ